MMLWKKQVCKKWKLRKCPPKKFVDPPSEEDTQSLTSFCEDKAPKENGKLERQVEELPMKNPKQVSSHNPQPDDEFESFVSFCNDMSLEDEKTRSIMSSVKRPMGGKSNKRKNGNRAYRGGRFRGGGSEGCPGLMYFEWWFSFFEAMSLSSY